MQLGLRSEAKSVFAARIAPGAMMETMMVDGLAARDLALLGLGLDLLGRDCGGSCGAALREYLPTSTPQPKPAQA